MYKTFTLSFVYLCLHFYTNIFQFDQHPCRSTVFIPVARSLTIHWHCSYPLLKVLDPEKQADLLDSLRICLLQFSTLLVEHAPHHIHDNNKSRNSKLRRLMTFAWPCLLPKACVDPACKYSGHLLLAHIIAKFAIHKKIVLQVRRNAGSRNSVQRGLNWELKWSKANLWRRWKMHLCKAKTEIRWLQINARLKK